MYQYELKYFPVYYVARQKLDSYPAQMVPYSKDKSFKMRRKRINFWAGQKYAPSLFINNNVTSKFQIKGFTSKPKSVLNSTKGGWEITDPRGFTVDISQKNLEEVLRMTSIKNGIVEDEAIWGRMGGENWLAIKGSDSYRKIIALKEAHKNKIAGKNINVGDTVVLKNSKVGIYLGSYFPLIDGFRYRGLHRTNRLNRDVIWKNKYSFFLMKDKKTNMTWNVYAYSGLNILSHSDEVVWTNSLDEKACHDIVLKAIDKSDKNFKLHENINGKILKLSKTKISIKEFYFQKSLEKSQKSNHQPVYFRNNNNGQIFQLVNINMINFFKGSDGTINDFLRTTNNNTWIRHHKIVAIDTFLDEKCHAKYEKDSSDFIDCLFEDTEIFDLFVELENSEIIRLER